MKSAKIYCRTIDKGVQAFYLEVGNDSFYMFSQPYRKSVKEYYRNGVVLGDSFKCSRACGDTAVTRTMSKIPKHIRYIEKEYEIEILEQTKRKHDKRRQFMGAVLV